MKTQFKRLLARWGQRAALNGAEATLFLQPADGGRKTLPITATPLGAVSSERWIGWSDGDTPLVPGDEVRFAQWTLVVQQAQPFHLGDTAVYYRAVLRRRKEEAQ